jgi:hypothetical protein
MSSTGLLLGVLAFGALLAAFVCSLLLVFALDLLDRGGPQHDNAPQR